MAKKKYKVSIILPCCNVAPYVDAAIQSILKQTYKDYEVIFINDGSTDDTLDKVQQYCMYDNFHVYSFANQGVSQARNEGIRLSQGEYLYFMDSDDEIAENLLELALSECEKNHADAVQFHYSCAEAEFNGNKGNAVFEGIQIVNEVIPRFIGYSSEQLKKFGRSEFYDSNEWGAVWRFLFKASVIKDNQINFPCGVKMSEDRFFILKFLCYANKIVAIDNKLYHYFIRMSGCMSQGLQKAERLLQNKIDGVVERKHIRNLLLEQKNIDIFDLYSGSLVLSSLELYVKLSVLPFGAGWKSICCYASYADVKAAIKSCHILSPLKLSIPVLCIRFHLGFFMYSTLWLMKRLKNAKR